MLGNWRRKTGLEPPDGLADLVEAWEMHPSRAAQLPIERR
jgi:hypothetical protein